MQRIMGENALESRQGIMFGLAGLRITEQLIMI